MNLEGIEKYRVELPASALSKCSHHDQEGGFFYIPDFVTRDEEGYLLDKIDHCPKPKWKALQNRRLQTWGGQISSQRSLIPESMPDWLIRYPPLKQRIAATGAFFKSRHQMPNHCLINEYLPGQGIMPHDDGEAYHSAVATISLASHTVLDIYTWTEADEGRSKVRAREREPVFSILQEPRSLLLTIGFAYRELLHGIAERKRDECTHLSRVVNTANIADLNIRSKVLTARQCFSHHTDTAGQHEALIREKRLSLTFRDVERVSKVLRALPLDQ